MIIDTHCHYNLEPLASEWQRHWQEAQAKGVHKSIVIGTSVETSQTALEIANVEPNLFATIGIHPNEWEESGQADVTKTITQLADLITNPTQQKILAIGETGLDYFRQDKTSPEFQTVKAIQVAALYQQLKLALANDVPVILHVRDKELPETPTPDNAYWDVVATVAEFVSSHQPIRAILHCVSGPTNYLQTMLELGAYVGVAGNVTYKSAEQIRALALATPKDKLLLETDAPYLPPQTYRGQTCEPWMITETAEYLTKLTNTTHDQLMANTYRLFPQLERTTVQ